MEKLNDMPSRRAQFARDWVEGTWRDTFCVGVIIHDSPEARRIAAESSGLSTVEEELEPAFLRYAYSIYTRLRDDPSHAGFLLQQITQDGFQKWVRVATTREQLVHAIAECLEAEANAWSDGGDRAWQTPTVFMTVM